MKVKNLHFVTPDNNSFVNFVTLSESSNSLCFNAFYCIYINKSIENFFEKLAFTFNQF
jgi:hypothetical protein